MFVVGVTLLVTGQAVERARAGCRVALRTGDIVRSGQRERVVERGGRPCGCVVASLAVGGESQRDVVGRRLIVRLVARVASRGNRLERSAGVAAHAGQCRMAAAERKEIVVKTGAGPARWGMASLAIAGPAVGDVVGRRSAGEVRLVAQLALPGRTAKLADGSLKVAAFARGDRVRRDQVEAGPSVVGNRACRPPACLLMAFFTIHAEGGSMRVGVTSAAAACQIGTDRPAIIVTSQASRLGVSALQDIAGFARVVE